MITIASGVAVGLGMIIWAIGFAMGHHMSRARIMELLHAKKVLKEACPNRKKEIEKDFEDAI